jgi:hypothetical protein
MTSDFEPPPRARRPGQPRTPSNASSPSGAPINQPPTGNQPPSGNNKAPGVLEQCARGLASYWRWTTSGPKWKLAVGLSGPLLLLLIIISAASGGSDDTPKQAVNQPIAETTSDAPLVAGAAPTEKPANTPRPEAPTATPRPPTPTPPPAGYTFTDGTKQIGKDVQAGATYRTRKGSSGCYWARLTGFGGTIGEIAANDNTNAPAVVTIGQNDVGFQSNRCGTWTQDISAITENPTAPFKDGMFIVGVDIASGTWRADGASGCYWARLSNFSGGINGIIANDNVSGSSTIVTIGANDKGFESVRCGTWTKQ